MKPSLSLVVALISILPLSFSTASRADENWGFWRGPDSSGAAPDNATPPSEWSESKNLKWKVEIPGEGSGTPVIWGDRVFVQTAVMAGEDSSPAPEAGDTAPSDRRNRGPGSKGKGKGKGGPGGRPRLERHQFVLLCLDRRNGDILWQQTAVEEVPHEGHHQTHAFGSHSPVTDGKQVIGFFGSRGIFCYDLDGNLKWKRDLGDMTMRAGFGEGNSAAIHGETLIVPWDHEGDSALHALNVATGEPIWTAARPDEPTNWGSPLILEHGGATQVVITGDTAVRGYDFATGKELWRCGGQTTRPVASPVTDGQTVYVGSGFRGSYLAAIQLGNEGDLTGTNAIAWDIDRNTPDIASPLLSNGRLYFLSAKSAIVTCVDAATGKPLWGPERIPGLGEVYASLASANGNVYLVGREGTTVVFKEADQFEIVATNRLDDPIDGSPVFSGKDLLLRGKHFLYCLARP